MGSRKSQQDQVRTLMTDAIMMLCRKGLDNTSSFSVEALIGITLEDGDIVLMSINEKLEGPCDFNSTPLGAALNKVLPSNVDGEDQDPTPTWPSKRRIVPRSKISSNSKRKRGRPRKLTAITPSSQSRSGQLIQPDDGATIPDDGDSIPDEYKETGEAEVTAKVEVMEEDEEAADESTEAEMPDKSEEPENKIALLEQGKGAEALLGMNSDIPQTGPYNCSMCPAVYKYRKCLIEHQLKQHIAKKQEEVQESYPCESCDKVFGTKRSLTRHIVVHSPDRERFPCHICKKHFSCQRHVEFHIRTIHEGLYPYMCELCGKHATTKSSLVGHMASKHSVDKVHCSKCDRDYATHATFIRHICVERPKKFDETVCNVCNKSFDQPKRLIQHMSKHLDPKYQCETCGRSFKWVSSLQAHKVAAHKQSPTQKPQRSAEEEQQQNSLIHSQPLDTQESQAIASRISTPHEPMEPAVEVMSVDHHQVTPGTSYSQLTDAIRPNIYYTIPYSATPQTAHTTQAEMIQQSEWQTEHTNAFNYAHLPNNSNSSM